MPFFSVGGNNNSNSNNNHSENEKDKENCLYGYGYEYDAEIEEVDAERVAQGDLILKAREKTYNSKR